MFYFCFVVHCAMCILSVHVMFTKLYIFDNKFYNAEDVNTAVLKFNLLAPSCAGRVTILLVIRGLGGVGLEICRVG